MRSLLLILFSIISFFLPANSKSTLTFRQENAVYEIKENYDLAGKTITIPAGCTLRYKGGKINNGTLKGSGTMVDANYNQIFGNNLRFEGSWNVVAWLPEWFGAKGEEGKIDTKALQCALDAARDTDSRIVQLQGRTYYTDAPLSVYPYTSLIGADLTASWLNATQIMPTSDVNGVQLTAVGSDAESCCVTIKNLIIRNGHSNYSNVGLLISKDSICFGVSKLRLENVQILYFNYGIMADLYGMSPFAYCDFRNVECNHNNIGLYVEGHYDGDKCSHKIWMNLNRFEFCRFSENRIGGVYVHDVWNLFNNTFDQCCFEGNGRYYSLTRYNQYGAYGAKFSNTFTPSSGGNIFQNCYFEVNIPQRKGSVVEKEEYKYGEIIYPVGFLESKTTGNVILQQHSFSFDNCVSSRNKCFVLLNDNSHINITRSFFYDLEQISMTDFERYFIEFNDTYVPSSVYSERNSFNISHGKKFHYFHFITTPNGKNSIYSIQKDDTIDGGTVKLDNSSIKKLLKNE